MPSASTQQAPTLTIPPPPPLANDSLDGEQEVEANMSSSTLSTQSTQGDSPDIPRLIPQRVSPTQLLNEYKSWLEQSCQPPILSTRSHRQTPQEFEIPVPSKEGIGNGVNYTIGQMKQIASEYSVKRSGTKSVLRQRVHTALVTSFHATEIQRIFRGYIVRRYIKAKGLDGPKRPTESMNDTELGSLTDVAEIEFDMLINIPNSGGKNTLYSVDTLYGVIKTQLQSNREPTDPYTNIPFKQEVMQRVAIEKRLARVLDRRHIYCKCAKCRAEKAVKATAAAAADTQRRDSTEDEYFNDISFELRVLNICSKLDQLGHTTHTSWFTNLSTEEWRRFNNEMADIWAYRGQIPFDMRHRIAGTYNLGFIPRMAGPNTTRRRALENIRRLILWSSNPEHQALGAYYVLIALTIVSREAAEELPWLYEAGRFS